MITVQNTQKYFKQFQSLNHDNVVSKLNTFFENTVRRVNKCLETGEGNCERYLLLSVL
jgi:hypothetical protein